MVFKSPHLHIIKFSVKFDTRYMYSNCYSISRKYCGVNPYNYYYDQSLKDDYCALDGINSPFGAHLQLQGTNWIENPVVYLL